MIKNKEKGTYYEKNRNKLLQRLKDYYESNKEPRKGSQKINTTI